MDRMEYSKVHCLSCFTVISACCAEAVENLTGIVGGSITFPGPAVQEKGKGFLLRQDIVIASVRNDIFGIEEDIYKNRLHWNNNTGHFTITGLQKNDTGVYTVNFKKGNVSFYALKVYGK